MHTTHQNDDKCLLLMTVALDLAKNYKETFFKPSISGIFRENQNFPFNSQKIKLNLLEIKSKLVHILFSDHYLLNGDNMSILGNIFSMCKLPKKKRGPSPQLELACMFCF